ncbi:uncharacterized protein LOC133830706 [Humulus lupulus]|uniref:uncharacterized protein LOC133801928 n=1 Tax=Humulus lupulus TaxID=3486 RepID=UPI002B413C3E|nr:uncharacterized protein LOC133801928 [Humulus lupulus]XP_062115160.1 uncharacterized protein LOC133829440 [Humulus lupulus]XP_062116730.1 uncharacterized protein LOC133830706 [Humulus lupulus]
MLMRATKGQSYRGTEHSKTSKVYEKKIESYDSYHLTNCSKIYSNIYKILLGYYNCKRTRTWTLCIEDLVTGERRDLVAKERCEGSLGQLGNDCSWNYKKQ